MVLRKCKKCECPMDPGEGRNGVCEDCISREKREREKKNVRFAGADPGPRDKLLGYFSMEQMENDFQEAGHAR